MPRAKGRASTAALDKLHRLTAKALTRELERALTKDEGIPAALLAQAIKFQQVNGVDTPSPCKSRVDKLADELPDFGSFGPPQTHVS